MVRRRCHTHVESLTVNVVWSPTNTNSSPSKKKAQLRPVRDSKQKVWRSSGRDFGFGVSEPCEESHSIFSSADLPRSNDETAVAWETRSIRWKVAFIVDPGKDTLFRKKTRYFFTPRGVGCPPLCPSFASPLSTLRCGQIRLRFFPLFSGSFRTPSPRGIHQNFVANFVGNFVEFRAIRGQLSALSCSNSAIRKSALRNGSLRRHVACLLVFIRGFPRLPRYRRNLHSAVRNPQSAILPKYLKTHFSHSHL